MKLLVSILLSLSVNAQTLISCDDFENGLNGWQFTYPVTHVNSWKVSTAATGSNAMFVTCDNVNFNYCNAASGTERIVAWKQFNTSQCNGYLQISYNWIGVGQSYAVDYGSWGQCSGNPTSVNSWAVWASPHNASYWLQPSVWNIPINWTTFYSSTFKFGFIFECNSTVTGSTSFAFDNFCITCMQLPLSLDTTQTLSVPQQHEPYNPIEAIYNLQGQQVSEIKEGFYIIKRRYTTEKIISNGKY